MEKEFKIESINYHLYQARIKKGVSIKEAAKNLKLSKLHLNLIEKGYLHVSKKIKPRLIDYYHLDNDFFEKNTTYVVPINVNYDDPQLEEKLRNKGKTKRTKIISGIISGLMICMLGLGAYFNNWNKLNPRAEWTSEFAEFRDKVIKDHDETSPSIEYPGDTEYIFEKGNDYAFKARMLGQEANASGFYIDFVTTQSQINVSIYNQKKIGYSKVNIEAKTFYALWSYEKIGEYNMPRIYDENNNGYNSGSSYYEAVKTYLFDINDGAFKEHIDAFDNIIRDRYSTSYNFEKLTNDLTKISIHEVQGFQIGFRMILFSSIILILSLATFVYALIKGRKVKPKKVKEKPYVVHKTEYTADPALVYRSMPNDSKFPMVVPEFVLRILALAILLLASIGTIWATNNVLTGQESMKETIFNAYVSNLLVAGITLAFFLKLDIFHKKTNKELLENVCILFVFGLVFYVAECITYASLSSQGNIYSELVKLLSGLLPGNIIWNLMLYSLIFFFLFTLPKKLEDAPHKVLLWRLCSVFPTLLLLAAFIYKGTFQGVVSPYVSFLFHTNGLLSTAFAIFYLYSLFFFQQYMSLKYGKEFTKVYLDSRRYALNKNIIACVVIAILTLIDLAFYFYLPINSLNLGNNWIIAILIPFILFYRPHIGKRMPKWDLIYTIMHITFLVGGFVVAFNMIANALDLNQIYQIMR